MVLTRAIIIQLAVFSLVAVTAGAIMIFDYIGVPDMMGIGRYTVHVELPEAAGLYAKANVTYRGTEVGRVTAVRLSDNGVQADLTLRSDVPISSDLIAQVHSVSGIGEQYVALLPRGADAPPLKNGDVIPVADTTVPPDIGSLLDATNRGLQAIPRDNLKTVVDEGATAVGGLGPELSRIVRNTTKLTSGARQNLDSITTLIDKSQPVLDSQTNTADAVSTWAANLAAITHQFQVNDAGVAGVLEKGAAAADQGTALFDRLQPTLPVLLANLVSLNQVAITYQPAIEQILVLLPLGVADLQATALADRGTQHPGQYLNFKLNINLPPACTTGYLPAQQIRPPSDVDSPDRPPGQMYCRIPQDAPNAVRGARNYPCLTRPGKRAPTVKMCESDEQYVPLNDGNNWKGDPNATLSGQDIPQLPPGSPPPGADPAAHAAPPPPIAAVQYDPANGSYIGPDGRLYTQSDLAQSAKDKTWQSMLTPPN
jgi:phospholipid/cholesterol/gamma-HCH transport system substrate-binding protein